MIAEEQGFYISKYLYRMSLSHFFFHIQHLLKVAKNLFTLVGERIHFRLNDMSSCYNVTEVGLVRGGNGLLGRFCRFRDR